MMEDTHRSLMGQQAVMHWLKRHTDMLRADVFSSALPHVNRRKCEALVEH